MIALSDKQPSKESGQGKSSPWPLTDEKREKIVYWAYTAAEKAFDAGSDAHLVMHMRNLIAMETANQKERQGPSLVSLEVDEQIPDQYLEFVEWSTKREMLEDNGQNGDH